MKIRSEALDLLAGVTDEFRGEKKPPRAPPELSLQNAIKARLVAEFIQAHKLEDEPTFRANLSQFLAGDELLSKWINDLTETAEGRMNLKAFMRHAFKQRA